MNEFYGQGYSNIHRGVYGLSEQATLAYEEARAVVARFIGAGHPREIIFTHGTTESINLVAYSFGEAFVQPGDEIAVSLLEHHANLVPWQLLGNRRGAHIRYVEFDECGRFDFDAFQQLLTERTKLVAVTQLANALGVTLPISRIVEAAHRAGAKVLVDGAQGICHLPTDVEALGVDFYAFSGHKLYGPTGVGVLFGKQSLLEAMPPFLSGGDMIRSVSVHGTVFGDLPHKFEAGTPHIAGVLGLRTAIDYLEALGRTQVFQYEDQLVRYLEEELSSISEVTVLGGKEAHVGLCTFTVDGIHPHDLAQFLSSKQVAVRAGHHCAQPLLNRLGLQASTRASVGLYNTTEDVDRLKEAIEQAISFFR